MDPIDRLDQAIPRQNPSNPWNSQRSSRTARNSARIPTRTPAATRAEPEPLGKKAPPPSTGTRFVHLAAARSPARCGPVGSSRPSHRAAARWRAAPRTPSTAPRTARPSRLLRRSRHLRAAQQTNPGHDQNKHQHVREPTPPTNTTRTRSPPPPSPSPPAAIGSIMHVPARPIPAA
jgi:hypothetical protein